MIPQQFVVEMELVFVSILVHVSLVILEQNAWNSPAMEFYQSMQVFVHLVEHV
jgi:hypothetical protein